MGHDSWKNDLTCRYGKVARSVLGWYDTLDDDEAQEMTPQLLAGLCNAVMLVPVLAELTGTSRDAVLVTQVGLAVAPHQDRLLAWVEGLTNGTFS